MFFLQFLIHKLEEAGGNRIMRWLLAFLAILLLTLAYDLRCYTNFSTQEAMDSAQLARNIAEGKGYTTLFVRPFSMFLVGQRGRQTEKVPEAKLADYSKIRTAHPDISNPPVYPLVLAGLMKVLPFHFKASASAPFWSNDRRFWRYEPDFLIAVFDELLFFAVVVVTFYWARRLLDGAVAWTSAALLLGTHLLWRFSVSGLSTMLLLLIFMGLVWCLTALEAEAREPKHGRGRLLLLGALAGALTAVGGLTRYSFAWVFLPALIFVALFSGPRRVAVCLMAVAAFGAVMTPWLVRNYNVSGTLFGTAGFHALENTALYPGDRLQRSLAPDIRIYMPAVWHKLLLNLRLMPHGLPADLGGWVAAFFLVGLLVGFRNPSLRRMRYFLLMSLGVLVVVQALGRTQLAVDSPVVNSENLLVLLVPLVMVYGVSLFFMLLDQIKFPEFVERELRFSIVGGFGVLMCLPMILALLPPKTIPVAYPPYHPLVIQRTADWLKPNELMMSDIPWAVAWYGDRQCVWLTLRATQSPKDPEPRESFFAINDYQKPISGLYLTPKSLDGRFLSDWVRGGDTSWGSFIVEIVLKREVPPNFPLRQMPNGYLPEQLFLSDWKRW